MRGAVLESPSSVVNPGYPVSSKAAWTLGGQPLPAVPTAGFGRADPGDAQDASLPVEKVSGPVVTIAVIAQRAGLRELLRRLGRLQVGEVAIERPGGQAGNKDDRFDAFVLSDTLRTDR